MDSSGRIRLKSIWKMLDKCAPGWEKIDGTHKFIVTWEDKTFPSLPNGAHGKSNPEIERGHVKRMARALQILDCAKKAIPSL